MYHDYETDFTGDYTLSIGVESEEVNLTIEEGKYEVFLVEPNDPKGVGKAWAKIWELEKQNKLNRSYTKDYEKYGKDGKVEIYICVK